MFPYSLYISCTFKNHKVRILEFSGQRRKNVCPSLSADLFNKMQYFDFLGNFPFNGLAGDGCNASEASGTLARLLGSYFSCLLRNCLELNMFFKKANQKKPEEPFKTLTLTI